MGYWYAGAWCVGDQISLSVTEPGFLFGATIFTTLRVVNHRLDHPNSHWRRHGNRLRQTIAHLGWTEPNWLRVAAGATRVAMDYPVVRITLFSDGRELILGRPLPQDLAQKQQQGVAAWVAEDPLFQRPLADFKTGNYLGAWQALQRAIAQGAGEAILINTEGDWLETATGNLWGFAAGRWYTPPIGGILPGVMRSHLLGLLQQCGETVREQPWNGELLQRFEAIAYSNSVVGVIPLTKILGTHDIYPSKADHPEIRRLQKLSGVLDFVTH
jgi:4-amino-4-deoxychorismate lyase